MAWLLSPGVEDVTHCLDDWSPGSRSGRQHQCLRSSRFCFMHWEIKGIQDTVNDNLRWRMPCFLLAHGLSRALSSGR